LNVQDTNFIVIYKKENASCYIQQENIPQEKLLEMQSEELLFTFLRS